MDKMRSVFLKLFNKCCSCFSCTSQEGNGGWKQLTTVCDVKVFFFYVKKVSGFCYLLQATYNLPFTITYIPFLYKIKLWLYPICLNLVLPRAAALFNIP